MTALLKAEQISKAVGKNLVFDRFSLEIHPGDKLMLLGPNGAGKSTLLKLFVKLLTPDRGSIIRSFSDREIGYVAHDPLVFGSLTVIENLRLFSTFHQSSVDCLDTLIERFNLTSVLDRRVVELSRGQQAKIGIVRAFVARPKALFLDEPSSTLDDKSVTILRDLWQESISDRDGAGVIATHDILRLEGFYNRVVVIDSNSIASDSRALQLQGESVDAACKLSIDVYRGINR